MRMRDEKEDVGRGNSALGGFCSAELLFVDAWLKSVLFDKLCRSSHGKSDELASLSKK